MSQKPNRPIQDLHPTVYTASVHGEDAIEMTEELLLERLFGGETLRFNYHLEVKPDIYQAFSEIIVVTPGLDLPFERRVWKKRADGSAVRVSIFLRQVCLRGWEWERC
jgi:hypothetical protein